MRITQATVKAMWWVHEHTRLSCHRVRKRMEVEVEVEVDDLPLLI